MPKQKSLTKVGLAGGIAGSMEIAVTYPLEYVKTNVQLQHGAAGPAFVDGPDGEKGINVPAKRLRAYGKSRATTLNETLDAATRSLVRFLEKTQHCRVAKLAADYVVENGALPESGRDVSTQCLLSLPSQAPVFV